MRLSPNYTVSDIRMYSCVIVTDLTSDACVMHYDIVTCSEALWLITIEFITTLNWWRLTQSIKHKTTIYQFWHPDNS